MPIDEKPTKKKSTKDPIVGPWGNSTDNNSDSPKGEKPNPWGDQGKKDGPRGPFNDPQANKKLEETLESLQIRIKETFGGGGGGGGGRGNGSKPPIGSGMPGKGLIIGGSMVVLALWLSTGFFRVQENELAVVMRFGKMDRVVSAGWQYHLPSPIESVRTENATIRDLISSQKNEKNPDSDPTLILTGDEKIIHCNYTVRWRIKDISEYLFTAKAPETTIKAAADSVTREVVGQSDANAVLTSKKEEIAEQARKRLQDLMDQYKLGVTIVAFQLRDVAVPEDVVESYKDVVASVVDAQQEINKAESYRNDIIPRARGAAIQIVQESEAYRDSKIAEAEGEATRFKQVYDAYSKNKSIAVIRYYLDTMQKVLSQTNKMIFDPKVSQGVLPYLPLNDMKKSAEKATGEQK